ncbi:MAG TPA: MFS transporter [Micromonosporaceae bacterium]
MRARLGTTFESLSVRNYRLFAGGQLTKLIGVWMQFIAQDWLVLELSNNSAYALGVVTALQFVPVVLLTLYGGKLADRYDKRRLLIAANAIFSGLALALGLLVASGTATLAVVYVFASLLGVVNAIETPVRQAFVSELVPTRLLPNALSLSAATFNSARIVGPALAGGAIALMGTGPVFLVNAATYLAPAIALIQMRPADLHRAAAPTRTDGRVRDGVRYVWHKKDLLLPIVMMFVIGMVGFNFQLTLAVLAKTVFETGPESFGLLTTALAVGSLIGALASSGRRARPSAYAVLGAAIGFGALETLVGFAPTFLSTAALLIPTGFFMIYFAQAANQRLQLGTDPAFRGRVMAIYVFVFLGTTPIGAPAIGWLSEHYGPRLAIWAGGLLSMTMALVALAWQLRHSGARLRLRLRPLPKVYVCRPADVTATAVAKV